MRHTSTEIVCNHNYIFASASTVTPLRLAPHNLSITLYKAQFYTVLKLIQKDVRFKGGIEQFCETVIFSMQSNEQLPTPQRAPRQLLCHDVKHKPIAQSSEISSYKNSQYTKSRHNEIWRHTKLNTLSFRKVYDPHFIWLISFAIYSTLAYSIHAAKSAARPYTSRQCVGEWQTISVTLKATDICDTEGHWYLWHWWPLIYISYRQKGTSFHEKNATGQEYQHSNTKLKNENNLQQIATWKKYDKVTQQTHCRCTCKLCSG